MKKSTKEAEDDAEATGLSWPKSWPGAYGLVLAMFAFYVVFLVLLEATFR